MFHRFRTATHQLPRAASPLGVLLGALLLLVVGPAIQDTHAQYATRVVARSGDEPPGVSGDAFQFFRIEGLSEEGSALFHSVLETDALDGYKYWIDRDGELQPVPVRKGEAVPGLSGVLYDYFEDPSRYFRLEYLVNLSGEDQLAVEVPFSGPAVVEASATAIGNASGVLVESPAGLRLAARQGQRIREGYVLSQNVTADLHLSPFGAANRQVNSFNDASMVFAAPLHFVAGGVVQRGPPSVEGVFVADETGLTEVALATEWDNAPPMPGVEGFLMDQVKKDPLINPSGQVLFVAWGREVNQTDDLILSDRVVLYRWSEEAGHEVLLNEPRFLDPGGAQRLVAEIETTTINAAGQVGFYGLLPGTDERGIYVIDGPGAAPRTVVQRGDPAPGTGGASFARIDGPGGLSDPRTAGFVLLGDGRIALFAVLDDGRSGLWLETDTGLVPVVLEGDPVPGTVDGVTFRSISNMVANSRGEVAFAASLEGSGLQPGVNDEGLWTGRLNALGEAQLTSVLRAGDRIEVAPGVVRTLSGISVPNAPFGCGMDPLQSSGVDGTGADGLPTYFNDRGALFLEACFGELSFDPSSALVVASRSLIVNTTADEGDADPADGLCDAGGAEIEGRPRCTLRAAIEQANARTGTDDIRFDIPTSDPGYEPAFGTWRIQPTSALPVITEPVDVEGPTQEVPTGVVSALRAAPTDKRTSFEVPQVILDGSRAGAEASGLVFGRPTAALSKQDGEEDGGSIRTLIIGRFFNGMELNFDGTHVAGCRIGVDPTGQALNNRNVGIQIRNRTNVMIGGPTVLPGAPPGNVIAGNVIGVRILEDGAQRNQIVGNYIGGGDTPDFGTLPKNRIGVRIQSSASTNVVGGNTVTEGNVIAGNEDFGILITENARENRIEGNLIGGIEGHARNGVGLRIEDGAAENVIGGETEAVRNLISRNDGDGIQLFDGAAQNRIQGNYVGTDRTGTHPRSNADSAFDEGHAIYIQDAPDNLIGGLTETPGRPPGNLIYGGGSLDFPVVAIVEREREASGNTIQGNLLGTTADGSSLLTDFTSTVGINVHAPSTTIGGTSENARNVIAGYEAGIVVGRVFGRNGRSNEARILGNYIGTDISGETLLDVDIPVVITAKVVILEGGGHTVGGAVPLGLPPGTAPGNLIAGSRSGIVLEQDIGDSQFDFPLRIQGNVIGLSTTGDPLLQAPSPRQFGIGVIGSGVLVGGNEPGSGNVIAGGWERGIFVKGASDSLDTSLRGNHVIRGNLVGLNWREEPHPNQQGIVVEQTQGNQIGGNGLLDGNRVAHNGEGIVLKESRLNQVVGNRIEANATGLRLRDEQVDAILNNQFRANATGLLSENGTRIRIEGNTGIDNTGPNTGFHLFGTSGTIAGNQITGDAGDAIVLEDGSTASVTANNLSSNAGVGLRNTDPSVTIDARGNWWGDAAGPDAGDGVAGSVDASDWQTEPVSLVAFATTDTLYVPVGERDTAGVAVRNWQNPTESVQLSITDDAGWAEGALSPVITLDEDVGGGYSIPIAASGGSSSTVRITATSQTDPSVTAADSFVVQTYAPALAAIGVAPDTARVLPGETTLFTTRGTDQFGRFLAVAPTWSATGGTIDADGRFTAGPQRGRYTVTAAAEGLSASAVIEVVGEDGQIPVELASFTAAAEGTVVRLAWQTASELNNAGFHVERRLQRSGSTTYSPWTPLTFIDGVGTTAEPQRYRFADRSVPPTTQRLEYRLRQIDLDGTASFSAVVQVEISAPSRFTLYPSYPNPTAGQATIPFDVSAPARVRLAVYDLLGRRVTRLVDREYQPGRYTAVFDTGRLASGVYFVVAEMESYRGVQKLSVLR